MDSPKLLLPLLRDDPDFSALLVPELWTEIQRVSVSLKMAPVVAYAARAHGSPEQRAWCDSILTASWAKHDKSIRELDWILGIFESARIEVLALKGPILGCRHFQPPFLRRPSVDLDLGVADHDLERAVAALAVHGYQPGMTLAHARATSHHLEMICPGRKHIELHTRLSKASLAIPIDDFFAASTTFQLPTGRLARIPDPAHELLGLMVHVAGDRFSSFFHLFELRRIWHAADTALRATVFNLAAKYRLAGTLWLIDAAFRSYWDDSLLGDDSPVRRTWLHTRLNADLLRRMERNALTSRDRSLVRRLEGRWLDLYMTESPADAVRVIGLILRVAVREMNRGNWGTIHRS